MSAMLPSLLSNTERALRCADFFRLWAHFHPPCEFLPDCAVICTFLLLLLTDGWTARMELFGEA
jgi:hypothetical protein